MSRPPGPPPPGVRPAASPLRWRLASQDASGALFSGEELVERHAGVGEYRSMEFLHVNAKRLVNRIPDASRVPFRHTVNPYRGCSHACVYCFARPTHEYLGLGAGEDFERRIVVKVNAVERLRAELRSARWSGEHIAMGTNTDPYQKAEAKYHLTRGIVEVLGRHANPFGILTKSTLILRDLDVLLEARERTELNLAFSIGTLDREVWRLTEPGTPPPDKRVDAVRRLTEAGLRCSVLLAPILPGLSDRDEQVEEVARACVDAGAVSVSPVALHLRPGVREHYLGWLGRTRPDLAGLHAERFERRSYQPAAVHEHLRGVVDAVTHRARRGRRRAGGAVASATTSPRPAMGGDASIDGSGSGTSARGEQPCPAPRRAGEQLQLF